MVIQQPTRRAYPSGTRILGRYIVEAAVTRGTLWDVYTAASDEPRQRPVVVRVLRLAQQEHTQALLTHAQSLIAVVHAGLVPVLATGLHEGSLVIVSADVPGMPLRAALAAATSNRISAQDTARVVLEIGEALQHLHTRTPMVIHGALAPRKIVLVGPERHAMVLEWGHAQLGSGVDLADGSADRGAVGCYRAPEVFDASLASAVAADQFVLASIAYECITGGRAFPGEHDALEVIRSNTRPWIASLRSDLPDEIDAVLHRAWSLDPADRYRDVREFALEFATLLSRADETGRSAALSEFPAPPSVSPDLLAPHSDLFEELPPPATSDAAESTTRDAPVIETIGTPSSERPPTRNARAGTGVWIGVASLVTVLVAAMAFVHRRTPSAPRESSVIAASSGATHPSVTPAMVIEPSASVVAVTDASGIIADASAGTHPQTPATPVAPTRRTGPLPAQPTSPVIAQMGTSIQTIINDCSAGLRPLGRHVFVGLAVEGPTGTIVTAHVVGDAASETLRACIETHARALHAPPVATSRWTQSYHLLVP